MSKLVSPPWSLHRFALSSALILSIALPNGALAKTSAAASDIAKSKATMLASADKVYADIYLKNPAQFDKYNLTATQARAFSLWTTMAYSLGVCHSKGGDGLRAAWLSALDNFSPPPYFRSLGIEALENGKADENDVIGIFIPSDAMRFCRGEVSAVRQLLAERFNAK